MNEADFPGPQEPLKQKISERVYAYLLVLTVCALWVQAIIRENFDAESWALSRFWEFKFIDASTSATILIGFATIVLVRQQITLGFRPFVTFGIKPPVASSEYMSGSGRIRVVTIGNEGAGTALLTSASVSITLRNPREQFLGQEFDRIYDIFATRNLMEGRDYTIRNMGSGFTVAPHSDVRLMEYSDSFLSTVGRFDISIIFEGFLGDKYSKGIYCVPRRFERAIDNGEPVP